jgi:hypothetical protein
VSEVYCHFDKVEAVITAVRNTAETIRTYGERPDLYGHSRTARIAMDLHVVAALCESQVRGLRMWDVSAAKRAFYRALTDGEELFVGLWPIELDLPSVTGHVAYPHPDVTTQAQKLHSAAANLRMQAATLGEALVTPSSSKMCNELVDIADRVRELADSLTANNV